MQLLIKVGYKTNIYELLNELFQYKKEQNGLNINKIGINPLFFESVFLSYRILQALVGKKYGYFILRSNDESHKIVGTTFDPYHDEKKERETN